MAGEPSESSGVLTCFGHAVFALALAGFGVVSLVSGDFAYVWQSVPPWVPGRLGLAYASGALLLGCGVGLLWPRARAGASLALIVYALASMVLLHVPRVAMQPLTEVRWFELGEIATIVSGGWILFASTAPAAASGWRRVVTGERGARLAGLLFALALLPFGLSHFVYAGLTASMVPSWLPGHFGWAYLTGAGHIAAGLAILFGILPRLAATLEALMVSTFVVTVHMPGVLGAPGDRDQWTELFVACAIAGAAFLVAHSYRRPEARDGLAPKP
jgi:uncharacterized membrane protein